MSRSIAVHLTPNELLMIVACMDEVSITDHRPEQLALHERLLKSLRRAAPDQYQFAVDSGAIYPLERFAPTVLDLTNRPETAS